MARKTGKRVPVSTDKLSIVNPENIALRDDFIGYLKAINRSKGTCDGYVSDLNIFFVWVAEHANNKDFRKISKRDIIAYQSWLINENQHSPSRVRRLKAAISSLSNFCESILADDDPEYEDYRPIVRKIENPPAMTVREKTVWEDTELEDLLNLLVERGSYEQACVVALGMYGGRRKAEIPRFKVSDFAPDRLVCDNALYKSTPILTKGNKMLECYTLAKKFQPYLDLWMQYRKEHGIESEWLFPNKTDSTQSLPVSTLNFWTREFTELTGKDFYMHSLRHYFVSALSRAGIPDNIVVQIIGWSSADMFNIYNDNSKDDQLAQYFKDGDICTDNKKSLTDL